MPSLNIPPAEGAKHDFLALGALVTRLDPGIVPFSMASEYQLHVSGGEYNVAANLSRCFGLKTAIASAMVDRLPIALKVQNAVREAGVEAYYRRFTHDGVRGPNIAQVWSDRGKGPRAPVVFYNRANEAAALLGPGSFDWSAIFGPADTRGTAGRGSRQVVSFGRHLLGPLVHDARARHRGHEGREGVGSRHFLRPQLPSQDLGRRRPKGRPERRRRLRWRWPRLPSAASLSSPTSWSATRRISSSAWASSGPSASGTSRAGSPAKAASKLDPAAFLGMMSRSEKKIPRREGRRRRLSVKFTRPTAMTGARYSGSMARAISPRRANSTSTTASAAATASRPASSTAC